MWRISVKIYLITALRSYLQSTYLLKQLPEDVGSWKVFVFVFWFFESLLGGIGADGENFYLHQVKVLELENQTGIIFIIPEENLVCIF